MIGIGGMATLLYIAKNSIGDGPTAYPPSRSWDGGLTAYAHRSSRRWPTPAWYFQQNIEEPLRRPMVSETTSPPVKTPVTGFRYRYWRAFNCCP